MRSIFWLNFLEGPKTNSELGRKRRKIGGTQFSFPLADDAEITISFSFFSGPAYYFTLYWLTLACSPVHSENEFVAAICNSLVLRDELVHERRTLRWRAFFRTFVSHSGY